MMKVCIIGCGAVGGIYAAHLAARDDIEVWTYDVNATHVDAINKNGLQLRGVREFDASINATTDPAVIPACDYVLVATKTYHTRAAIEATALALEDSIICSFQNGVGSEEVIAEHIKKVLTGSTLLGGHISGPGIIEFDTDGKSLLGPADTGSATFEQAQSFAAVLLDCKLEAKALHDPRGTKWTKLIFNSAANSLCALTRSPFGTMYEQEDMRELMYGIANEGIAVAEALGITLESDPIEHLDKAYGTAKDHIPSTMSDILNNRKTEIDALNGGIVKYARQVDVPCPLNQSILALIQGLEASYK